MNTRVSVNPRQMIVSGNSIVLLTHARLLKLMQLNCKKTKEKHGFLGNWFSDILTEVEI